MDVAPTVLKTATLNTMQIYHLMYQSIASDKFTGEELPLLIQQASHSNQDLGVTGLLLYTPDGRFAQVLEGPKQLVLELYQRIVKDMRNHTCEVLEEGPWSRRSFSNWCVALADCAVLPTGLPLVRVNFHELPTFLPKVAPTRPMLVHRLLSFVEPYLSPLSY